MVRYTAKALKELKQIVSQKRDEGLRFDQIAEHLNSLGLKNATGKSFTGASAWYAFNASPPKQAARAQKNTGVTEQASSNPVIAALYTDPHLSDAQFKRMVGAYLNEI